MAKIIDRDAAMKYYLVQFGYNSTVTVSNPLDDDPATDQASKELYAADKLVEGIAAKNNLEIIHGYSWPDGSLYKYLKSELGEEEIKQIFLDSGTDISVYPEKIDENKRSFADSYVSIKERFEIYRLGYKEQASFREKKLAEYNEFMREYEAHSSNCDHCAKELGCAVGLGLFVTGKVRREAWLGSRKSGGESW